MTVRDLLSHTSGLTYGFTERTNVDAAYRKLGVADRARPGYTLQAMVNTLAHLPLEAAIRRYIDITNEHPKPLKWTKTADEDPRECRTLLSSYL